MMERTLADFTSRRPANVASMHGTMAPIALLGAVGASVALWATIIAAVMAVV
jgi:hypothetical protein